VSAFCHAKGGAHDSDVRLYSVQQGQFTAMLLVLETVLGPFCYHTVVRGTECQEP
jgi:hypothetical protein